MWNECNVKKGNLFSVILGDQNTAFNEKRKIKFCIFKYVNQAGKKIIYATGNICA